MVPIGKFLIVLILCISRTQGADIRVKGDKCSNLDACRTSKTAFRTCSCEDDCYKYGTCCTDAEHFALMSSQPREYRCHDGDRVVTPVFAKRTCSVGDPTVCMETDDDKVDVLNTLLVTSSKTKITYWNKNCGVCNSEDLADLTPWTVQVVCPDKHKSTPIHQKLIRRNLTFSWESEEWGLKIGDEFVNCSIVQYQPPNSVGKLKYCAPTLVETCPQNHHGDSELHTYCSTYHGERKLKDANVYFKNVHCALCNGASLKDLECIGRHYGPLGGRTILSNTVKVVFTPEDWNAVMGGKHKYRCTKNFDYDPFSAKCRIKNKHSVQSTSNIATRHVSNLIVLFILVFVISRRIVF